MDISHPSSGMRKKYHYFLTLTRHAINQLPRQQICSSFFLQKEYLLAKKKKYCPSSIYISCNNLHIFAILHLLVKAVIKSCAHLFCTRVLGEKKQKAKIHVVITHFQSFYINKVITSQTMLMNVLTLRQKLAKFENYLNGSCVRLETRHGFQTVTARQQLNAQLVTLLQLQHTFSPAYCNLKILKTVT